MSEIFIVHDVEDEASAGLLAAALGARGVRTWESFAFAPERARANLVRAAIEHSAGAIVIWSPRAVVSDAIVDAAGHAAAHGKLSAAAFESVRPPPAFAGWTLVDLSQWRGGPGDGEIEELMAQVEARVAAYLPHDEAARRNRDRALSEDVRDLRKALRKPGAPGWEAYLRKRPDGVFAIVAGEQAALPPAYVSPAELTDAAPSEGDHWRYGDNDWGVRLTSWLGSPALRAGAALGVLTVLGVFGFQYLGRENEDAPTQQASLSAPAVIDAPSTPNQTPVFDAGAGVSTAPIEAIEPQMHARVVLPTPRVAPSRRAASLEVANIAPAPQQAAALEVAEASPADSSARPARVFVYNPPLSGRAFDRAALDRDTRRAVDEARRAEARATARALAASARVEPAAFAGADYQGERLQESALARGAARFNSGARYAGEWRAGLPDGYGVVVYADGVRYEGAFAQGRPTGRGALWSAEGARIVGEAQFARLVRPLT